MQDTQLLELFTQDIASINQLIELIDAEYQALQERDLEQLQALLSAKLPLLSLLDKHGKERSQLLKQAQVSTDRAGLASLAAKSEIGDQLLEHADQLNALFEQCQSANLRNGRIIRSGHAASSSMLAILRGNETPSLYNSTGTTAKIGQQRPLSQA